MNPVRGDEQVIAMLGRVTPGVRAGMLKTMESIGQNLTAYIQRNKLSGQVLRRRTGELSRSINNSVRDTPEAISAVVGSSMPGARYPAAHEYGFTGTVSVPTHVRIQTRAWGRPIIPRMVSVRAHPMRMRIVEKRYLRGALEEKANEEVAKIRASMAELIAAAKS